MRIFGAILCLSMLFPAGTRAQDSKENADFKLAINLYNDKLYDLAAEQLKQFINSYPSTSQSIEARLYLGLTQQNLKQFDDARVTFQTFALTYQDNPRAPEAWQHVGECFAAIHNYREAALAYERVKTFHPKSKLAPYALVDASTYFSLAGDPDDARRTLRIVLQEYGSSGAVLAARTRLGEMYFREGNIELARSELKRVIEGDPSPDARAEALLVLGNISSTTGNLAEAESKYQEIITRYGSTTAAQGAFVSLGRLQLASGNYSSALENLRKGIAIRTSPDSALIEEAMIATGDAYARQQQYTNAVAAYRRYLASFPDAPKAWDVWWRIALVNSAAKNFDRSDEACKILLKSTAPDLLKRRAQIRLARNAGAGGSPALAIQHYAAFLDQFPDDAATPDIVFTIGDLYDRAMHDPRKAIAYFELLQTRYGRSHLAPDAYVRAGRSYERLKEFDRALQNYQELKEKFPASPLCTEASDRIRDILIFEARDKDASLEKLALLLGDVVNNQDKSMIAFRLGEIYFHDLKNYAAAATQFTNVIANNKSDGRFVDALFNRAQAEEYLSWRDSSARDRAIEGYRNFLATHADDPRGQQAALSLFQLNARDLASASRAYAATLALYPRFARRDTVELLMGTLARSASLNDSAIGFFHTVLDSFPDSPSAEEALFQLTELYHRADRQDSVLTYGGRYRSLFPDADHVASVLGWLADAYVSQHNEQQAIPLFQRLMRDYPYTSMAEHSSMPLARAYLEAEQPRKALDLLKEMSEAREHDPLIENADDPELMLLLGKAYHAVDDDENAKKMLFRYLAEVHDGAGAGEAYSLLAVIFQDTPDLAAGYLRQAAAVSPPSAANARIADLLYDSGEYQDAIREYTQLATLDTIPEHTRRYQSRIILARLKNDELAAADKAIVAFVKTYRDDLTDAAAFELERGNYFFRKANYTEARKSFERVLDRYSETPSVPAALFWVGKTEEAIGKPQEALKTYASVLRRFPDAAIVQRTYLALGNIHYNAEQWDEAVKNYRRIVENAEPDPSLLPFAMNNLIETYESAGAFDAALDLTRRYLENYPNADDAFDKKIKIGLLYQKLGYYDQSIVHFQGLLDQAGSELEGELRYYIAEGNFYKGDYQQAILDFLKVPYLVTKKGKIDWTANSLYMSGQSYEKMGRYEQALTMYQQIIDRPGIDATFKAAARKEVDRVNLVLKKGTR